MRYTVDFDWGHQATGFGLAVLGSLTATSLLEQRRAAKSKRSAWLVEIAAAVALGACAIWAPRIAMITSMHVHNPIDGHVVAISFHRWLELACGFVPVLTVKAAIWIAARDPFFATSSEDRSEMLGKDLRQLSMKKVQRGGMWLILIRALVSRPANFLAGGFIMAVGVFISMWLGLWAMELDAHLVVEAWDVGVSGAVCTLVCTFLIWVLFRVLQWKPRYELLRVSASFIFAAALTMILHTSISSTHLEVDLSKPVVIEERGLVYDWAVTLAVVLCSMALYINVYDLRMTILAYRKDVDKLFRKIKPLVEFDAETKEISIKPNFMSQASSRPGTMTYSVTPAMGDKHEAALLECARVLNQYTTSKSMSKSTTSSRGTSRRDSQKVPSTAPPVVPKNDTASLRTTKSTRKVAVIAEDETEEGESDALSDALDQASQNASRQQSVMVAGQSSSAEPVHNIIGIEDGVQPGDKLILVRVQSRVDGVTFNRVFMQGNQTLKATRINASGARSDVYLGVTPTPELSQEGLCVGQRPMRRTAEEERQSGPRLSSAGRGVVIMVGSSTSTANSSSAAEVLVALNPITSNQADSTGGLLTQSSVEAGPSAPMTSKAD